MKVNEDGRRFLEEKMLKRQIVTFIELKVVKAFGDEVCLVCFRGNLDRLWLKQPVQEAFSRGT